MWKFKAKGYSILITRERTWHSDAWTVPKLNNSYLPSSIIILPDRNGGGGGGGGERDKTPYRQMGVISLSTCSNFVNG